MKYSGALKAQLTKAATGLNITHYTLPKITGTRFVSHRSGFERLLHMWPIFLTVYEDALVQGKQKVQTAAKIKGLLSKFRDVRMLYKILLMWIFWRRLVQHLWCLKVMACYHVKSIL